MDGEYIVKLQESNANDLYNILHKYIEENDCFTSGYKTAKEVLKNLDEQGL